MELELLTTEQIEENYNTRMKRDFPPNEVKPLPMILKAVEAGTYRCYGLMDEHQRMLGYAYLVRLAGTEDYFLDYLAVDENRRNEGIGSYILTLLHEQFKDADSLIIEVENPALSEDEATRILRTRRYGFYLRNGVVDSGATAVCFGAPFLLLEMMMEPMKEKHSPDQIRSLYKQHYKALLPIEMYEKNIIVG